MKIVIERASANAIQALGKGAATSEQQKRALASIVTLIGMANDLSYSETDKETNFNEGRRFVGVITRRIAENQLGGLIEVVETKEVKDE